MANSNRQQIVCDYIQENLVQFGRLRHDVISNKVQINDGMMNAGWRDITTSDINDIVCDCSAESGLSIAAKEVLAVLQSHRIPDVHPGRRTTRCVELARPAGDGSRRRGGTGLMAQVLHQMVCSDGSELAPR